MDFRALPPQCRQGIGRIHAGPDIIYEGEILDLLVQRRRDKARVVKLMRKAHRQAVAFGRTEAAHRAVTRRLRMELVHGRDAAGPQGVSDNAWSSLRAAPKLPSW
jgi:hypothetical protein